MTTDDTMMVPVILWAITTLPIWTGWIRRARIPRAKLERRRIERATARAAARTTSEVSGYYAGYGE